MEPEQIDSKMFDNSSEFYKKITEEDKMMNAVLFKGLDNLFNTASYIINAPVMEGQEDYLSAKKACELIVSRVVFDLRSVTVMLRLGHYMAAAAVATTIIELAWLVPYIGRDVKRAEEWLFHSDARNIAFGSFYNYLNSYLASAYPDKSERDEIFETVYQNYYRSLNEFKHGNSTILTKYQFFSSGDTIEHIKIPFPEQESFVVSCLIIQAVNYCIRECIFAYGRNHVPNIEKDRIEAFSNAFIELGEANLELMNTAIKRDLKWLKIMDKVREMDENGKKNQS